MEREWREKKMKNTTILTVLVGILLAGVISGCSSSASGGKDLEKIRLDYAYYSPTSLVLKEFGWAEEAFAAEGINVEFVLSQGSNKALEFLNSNSVDFGSAAGAAALIAKANGSPIEGVYIFSKPEWTALVTNKGSGISKVEDLRGKKVAATLGTDPFIFLLRALDEKGLSANDLEIVPLQHADGVTALTTNQVDAWAGLDPHMARTQLETGAELFYRNPDFNTYGFLNVRSEFAQKYPEHVKKVIELYERARTWAIEHPEETAEILAKYAEMDVEVATLQVVERNDFSNSLPGEIHHQALVEAGKVLQNNDIIKADVDLEKTVNELINPAFAQEIIK